MKITTEMTQAACRSSAKVYHNKISKAEALNRLAVDFGMNRNSASDYILSFKKMMEGKAYNQTNNAEATEYFFDMILNEYGTRQLEKALHSAKLHVEYYESLKKGRLNKIRGIIKKYSAIIPTNSIPYPDEVAISEELPEGAKKSIVINAYERNQKARDICIEHYGIECAVCDINFEAAYGELGKGFIHVHHLTLLSKIKKTYSVNPITDLRPVCPNCHAMLHKKNPPLSIEGLKEIILKK